MSEFDLVRVTITRTDTGYLAQSSMAPSIYSEAHSIEAVMAKYREEYGSMEEIVVSKGKPIRWDFHLVLS